jgi:hypothetical protein
VAVLKRDLIQSPTHLQFLINIVATKYSWKKKQELIAKQIIKRDSALHRAHKLNREICYNS